MILGSGSLTISHETVVMALQEYFDERLTQGHKIKVASVAVNGYDGKSFVLQIANPAEEQNNACPK